MSPAAATGYHLVDHPNPHALADGRYPWGFWGYPQRREPIRVIVVSHASGILPPSWRSAQSPAAPPRRELAGGAASTTCGGTGPGLSRGHLPLPSRNGSLPRWIGLVGQMHAGRGWHPRTHPDTDASRRARVGPRGGSTWRIGSPSSWPSVRSLPATTCAITATTLLAATRRTCSRVRRGTTWPTWSRRAVTLPRRATPPTCLGDGGTRTRNSPPTPSERCVQNGPTARRSTCSQTGTGYRGLLCMTRSPARRGVTFADRGPLRGAA